METYIYYALNERGHKVKGVIDAANEKDLEERLKTLELDLLSSRIKKESKGFVFSKGISTKDLIMMCVHLEQLDRAGVPILDSLTDLRDSTESPALKNLMSSIYEAVKGGALLSEALQKHPQVFSEVFSGLVSAGEQTGNLYDVFAQLAGHLKWVSEIRRKIKKAIYYPIFLLFLMCGIIALMMLFVIPQLSNFLKAQNFELPIYTRALIATSDFFSSYWYVVLGIPVIITVILKFACKMSESFAYKMDLIKLRSPILGQTIKKIELARFCRFFSITFKSGIGILECLEIASNVVQNRVMKESINHVKKSVGEGTSITNSLKESQEFPSLVIRMFKVGEDSGSLDTVLENVNFFYDKEVDDAVNGMVGFIQPALTIVLGGILLWISIAVFGPLYSSFSKMQF
ncbi:MAG: type II secretion system F family protein [Alphaproteobacteria bacterium]|nr:type II secretion system F family protein [Alphaproteobacteria bacterium]